jgi:hypothetical protein
VNSPFTVVNTPFTVVRGLGTGFLDGIKEEAGGCVFLTQNPLTKRTRVCILGTLERP